MFLAGLAVVFAGLLGGDAKVDAQIAGVVRELRVKPIAVPAASLRKLTHHAAATRELVRSMRVDGVIACEVIKRGGTATLRIVIYEGDGRLKTYSEIPIGRRGLTRSDLAVLLSNLRDDVTAMRGSAPDPDPEPDATIVVDDDDAPTGTPAPSHARVAAADDDSPDELGATSQSAPAPAPRSHTLQLGAAAGIGVASRSFTAPATVLPYSASPVPALVIDARVQPTRRLGVALGVERTLQLTTLMGDGSSAPTTISRWEGAATYTVATLGALELAPRIGGGRRSFTIDSSDPARSPDSEYTYLIAGIAATARLGSRITLRAAAAFEPVFGGEPTDMMLGEPSRWAIEVGAAVEVRASKHVFVRAAGLYQRFHWSWDMADGATAVDQYPSGALSLGADY